MKVGDLITWRKPNRRGERDPKGYGLIISAETMGQPSNLRLWLIVKWSNGKTESVPQWLLATRVKEISESR